MSKTNKQIIELAESLIKHARKKGANEIEINIVHGRSFEVDVCNGEKEKLVEAGDNEMSLRIIKDKKTASVNSSDFNKDTLQHLIDNAIKRADVSSPDSFAGLPELEKNIELADWKKLAIFDPKMEELTAEQKIEQAKKTEAICLKDKRIINSYGAGLTNSNLEIILVNSFGFCGAYKTTNCSLGIYLQAGEGDNKVEDGWYENSHSFDKLWQPERIAKTAIHRVSRLINPKKVKTQNVPVVLEPSMTSSILSFLYQCVNGRAIYMKQSFLVDKIGETIAKQNVNIVDNGLIPAAMGSKPFDSEGVPINKNVVVNNGVLKTYLTDTYSARKLKMKSTGNDSGANKFYIEKGKYSLE